MNPLLSPELTASWEKGLTLLSEGQIEEQEYQDKLEGFIRRRTAAVANSNMEGVMIHKFKEVSTNYS